MWRAIWFIRFAVVIPTLSVVLASSFHPRFPRILQPAMFFVVLTDGAGILAMIDIASHRELQYQTYYAGLMLVIMAAHSIYRLRFVYGVILSSRQGELSRAVRNNRMKMAPNGKGKPHGL